MRRISLSIVAVAFLLAASPARAQLAPAPKVIVTTIDKVPMVELYDGGGGLPYLGSSSSYNAGDWENALRAYANSGTYNREVTRVDRVAQKAVDRTYKTYRKLLKQSRKKHSKVKKPRKPAIVFDIDETTLSNYSAIVADNFTFGKNSQAEATNEIGVAIPSSLALYQDAISKHIAVFFITGRGEASRAHTEHNLQTQGYTKWNAVVLKPAGTTLSTVAYKSAARADIEKQGYEIWANVGDQYSDLAGGHADVAYKLANPFYFLP
jgi:acid phosphatase